MKHQGAISLALVSSSSMLSMAQISHPSGTVAGSWCENAVIVPYSQCDSSYPYYDSEGMICANDGEWNQAYCSYDIGISACAYCADWVSNRYSGAAVNENSCSSSWSGILETDYFGSGTWEVGNIALDLSSSAMVSIKTCKSEGMSYVTIYNSQGVAIWQVVDGNCGDLSWGSNQDLLIDFAAGEYTVEAASWYDGIKEFSLEVEIIGCEGVEAEESLDIVSVSEDSPEIEIDVDLEFNHPAAHILDVVTDNDCAAWWNGALWTGYGSEYPSYGAIGVTLTETTTVNMMTCGSDSNTYICIVQHFADANDLLIECYDDNNCVGGDDYSGNTMWNEDVSKTLSPGHYSVAVSGDYFTGAAASLEVRLDGCTEGYIHHIIGAIIGAVIGTICFCCFLAGIAKWCKLCCFKVKEATKAVEGTKHEIHSYPQSPASQVEMIQTQYEPQLMMQQPPSYVTQPQGAPQKCPIVQQCVYTSE